MAKAKIQVAWADPAESRPVPQPDRLPALLKEVQTEVMAQRDKLEQMGGACDAMARQVDRVLIDLFSAGVVTTRAARALELGRCS